MTPEQITALEGLVGGKLTEDQLRDVEPMVAERQDVQIAARLSAGRTRVKQPHLVGKGTISDALRIPAGPVFIYFLDKASAQVLPENADMATVEAVAMVKQARDLIFEANFDVGLPSVRAGLDQFVGKLPGFTQEAADAIKALAVVPNPLTVDAVSRALNIAEGRMVI